MKRLLALAITCACIFHTHAMSTKGKLLVTLSPLPAGEKHTEKTFLLRTGTQSLDSFDEVDRQLKQITLSVTRHDTQLRISQIAVENKSLGGKIQYKTHYSLAPGESDQLDCPDLGLRVSFTVPADR